MFVARLICSDERCAEEVAAEAATLRELEILACECGCALEIVAWPDWVDPPGALVALPARRPRGPLPEAA